MTDIVILPGSFKPPHKGHLSLIEKLIKKKNISKIIIIISNKSRALDNRFQYYEEQSKEDLQKALIEYYPNKNKEIKKMTKTNLLKNIKNKIDKNKIETINSKQSLYVWNIYLKYLKNKYKKLPKIIFKISDTNNIIKETIKIIFQVFRENKPKKIYLMKSYKDKNDKRFNFITQRFSKYIEVLLYPNIKDINAKTMRKSILKINKKTFEKYLPKNLNAKNQQKIINYFFN